jgi:hypothetical protein
MSFLLQGGGLDLHIQLPGVYETNCLYHGSIACIGQIVWLHNESVTRFHPHYLHGYS